MGFSFEGTDLSLLCILEVDLGVMRTIASETIYVNVFVPFISLSYIFHYFHLYLHLLSFTFDFF